jgi:hypothetical protein
MWWAKITRFLGPIENPRQELEVLERASGYATLVILLASMLTTWTVMGVGFGCWARAGRKRKPARCQSRRWWRLIAG